GELGGRDPQPLTREFLEMRRIRRGDPKRSTRSGEAGFALAIALFAMTTLMLVTAGALLVGSSNIEATRNYRGALQVHFVAESAISDALQMPHGPGGATFQHDVVTNWTSAWA